MKLDKIFKKVFKNFGNNFQSNSIGNIVCKSSSVTQINTSGSSTTTVNGKTYKGNNISINNGKVIIDGVEQTDNDLSKAGHHITVVVNGNCDKVETDTGDITINGNSGTTISSNGDIEISGEVLGNVTTSNGDVNVKGKITGNVSTSNGDITSRK